MEAIIYLTAKIFNIAPEEIELLKCNMGDVNASYIARMKNRKVFIKIENSRDLPMLYSGQIERELAGINLCTGKGISCPRLLACDITRQSFPQKYIMTEFFDYPLLSSVWNTLGAVNQQSIKKETLSLIGSLSEITSRQFGDIYEGGTIGHFDTWSAAFLHLIQIAVNDCGHYCTLNQTQVNTILLAAQACSVRLPAEETPCFCHLDLHWNNIFVNRRTGIYETKGIIDFGSSLYAPRYSDFFRLQGGFLYGTEQFYQGTGRPYTINEDQHFASDLYNSMDYFVFLSFAKQNHEALRNLILDKCNKYLEKCRV